MPSDISILRTKAVYLFIHSFNGTFYTPINTKVTTNNLQRIGKEAVANLDPEVRSIGRVEKAFFYPSRFIQDFKIYSSSNIQGNDSNKQ